MRRLTGLVGIAAVLLAAAHTWGQSAKVQEALPRYEQVSGISGRLTSIGSDSLSNLMALWEEEFTRLYPAVAVEVQSPGSSAAPTALIQGTGQLGPMSRPMKPEEEAAFEKKHGYRPTQFVVAVDCLAIFVHKDNPIHGLTFAQLDSIFSKTRKAGYTQITRWGDVGLAGEWASVPMSLYGRNSASGTYQFFKEHVLHNGDFLNDVKEPPGSAAVVNGIAKDRAGIGYSGIGYKTSEVRAIKLARKHTGPLVEPTFDNTLRGEYPLGRMLYIYVNKKPNESPPPLVREFLKFVLSKQGQEVVIRDGYGPLPAVVVARQLDLLK